MCIDIDSEELIHFNAAGKCFPKPPCLQTLHRWRMRGVRGICLETILVGGLRYTSREAIRRFVAAQNAGNTTVSTPVMTPSRRKRQATAAMDQLAAMGISDK